MNQFLKNVRNGIAIVEKLVPDWYNKIDLNTFNISSGQCINFQLGITSQVNCLESKNGFYLDRTEDGWESEFAAWIELQMAWVNEILKWRQHNDEVERLIKLDRSIIVSSECGNVKSPIFQFLGKYCGDNVGCVSMIAHWDNYAFNGDDKMHLFTDEIKADKDNIINPNWDGWDEMSMDERRKVLQRFVYWQIKYEEELESVR